MSIQQSYPKGTPERDDLVLGTKMPPANTNDEPKTQNFSVQDVAAFANVTAAYTVYTALLTQTGTAAPVAGVIQNTTGASLTWSRDGVGLYKVTADSGIFTAAKTIVFLNSGNLAVAVNMSWSRGSNTEVYIDSNGSDDVIDSGSFEVRIYS